MVVKLYMSKRHLRVGFVLFCLLAAFAYNGFFGLFDSAERTDGLQARRKGPTLAQSLEVGDAGPAHINTHAPQLAGDQDTADQEALLPFQSDDKSQPCPQWKGIEDVFVVMRTGATESLQKLPPQLSKTFKCIPHFAIFSDYEEVVDGHKVFDALDEYEEHTKTQYIEFDLHSRLKSEGRAGIKTSDTGGKDAFGWKLDKWKFLPLIDKILRIKPDAKWYVIMDADTHILWSNLLRWLDMMDKQKDHYLGAVWYIDGQAFAQGGSGMVISNPALKKVAAHRSTRIEEYNEYTSKKWAGDEILGKLFEDAGVRCTDTQPLLQSFSPSLMYLMDQLDKPEKRLHCYPAVSYHHMTAKEISDLFEFERWWTQKKNYPAIKHLDILNNVVLPQIHQERSNWDNRPEDNKFVNNGALTTYKGTDQPPSQNFLSDLESEAHKSFAGCRALCLSLELCMQFLYKPPAMVQEIKEQPTETLLLEYQSSGECVISKIFVQGHASSEAKDDGGLRSGWMVDRIRKYVKERDPCPKKDPLWIMPQSG